MDASVNDEVDAGERCRWRMILLSSAAGLVLVVPLSAQAADAAPAADDPATSAAASVKPEEAPTSAAPPSAPAAAPMSASATPAAAPTAAPALAPVTLTSAEPGWQMGFSGFAELDALYDTTQSFSETVLNNPISRPHTIAGDNPRFQITPKDSRFGFKVSAPTFASMKVSALLEIDFYGTVPSNASQDQSYTASSIRMRQYYTKLETPYLDLLVGQTNDLYGWGGAGFFPSTPAFLGVMGEVFHRNPQLRLSKVVDSAAVGFELAVAATRSATRDSAAPDLQAGAKLTINGWKGASAQGPRPAKEAPMAVGVSGVGRRLSVTDFSAVPGDPQVVYGWGAAVDVFLPLIPSHAQDLSNTLSVTGEFSKGTGVTDLYLTLTGGASFPSLPNPHNALPAPIYTPNVDPGIVTFDADNKVHTINWQGLMVNAHYHFPFRKGKLLSLSGTYSQVRSSNVLTLTPTQGRNFVWDKGQYADATLWWCITPAFQMALSGQTMAETYGDGMLAKNNRGQAAWWFFF